MFAIKQVAFFQVFLNTFEYVEKTNLDKFYDALGQAGLAETSQVLNDVARLKAHGDGRVQRVGCQLVLMDVFRPAHRLKGRESRDDTNIPKDKKAPHLIWRAKRLLLLLG